MAPVLSIKNQYLGINAHLHSLLQTEGGWNGFHSNHIADLARSLQAHLRPIGYEADIEQSVQIRRFDEISRYPKSDVTIYDSDPLRPMMPAKMLDATAHEVVMPIPVLLNLTDDVVEYYKAIGLYRASTLQERGEPIVWIELLSVSNKPTGRDFDSYREKRTQVLQSGIVFIEIDYLHQYPPTFESLPNYRPLDKNEPSEPGSHPYRITVIEPRPDFFEGQGRSRQFDVDEPIPKMRIPLSGDDLLDFDFGAPYRKTFEEMFYGDKVDYSQLPLNFELYSEDDRGRIVSRMLAVLDAAQKGVDLEREPEAVATIGLETAMEKLQVIRG